MKHLHFFLLSLFVFQGLVFTSCTKDQNIDKNIQVCRNNALITIPENQRLSTDLDNCPNFNKIRTDLQNNLTLKPDSKVPVLFIYLGYKKDIKAKMEDTYFGINKNEVEKNLNILALNIINQITFNNGLAQLSGATNRKIEIVLSDFAFSDAEINNMSVSALSSFLNNSAIRDYVKSLNTKRIKDGIAPIVEVFIMAGAEISSKATSITATSYTDGFGIVTYGNPPDHILSKGVIFAHPGLLHECFWHMISNDHQKKFLRFVHSPTGVDNLKYFQEIKHTMDNTDNWANSISSFFYPSGGTAVMLENGMSAFVNRYHAYEGLNRTNEVFRLDTIFLKSKQGIPQTIQTQDALYDGNSNRKLWEAKYNSMVFKYIDMFMKSEYNK